MTKEGEKTSYVLTEGLKQNELHRLIMILLIDKERDEEAFSLSVHKHYSTVESFSSYFPDKGVGVGEQGQVRHNTPGTERALLYCPVVAAWWC